MGLGSTLLSQKHARSGDNHFIQPKKKTKTCEHVQETNMSETRNEFAKKTKKFPIFTRKMREDLRRGQQLTDEHVNLAQSLLKEQFPHLGGFQNSLLSQNYGFIPQDRESIQIHFVGGNHWCVSASIGDEVTLYDSSLTCCLHSSLTHQMALIYRPLIDTNDEDGEDHEIVVCISDVQQQVGSTDCGVFAVAFALHLALGEDPSLLIFDQKSMRPHLIK